MALALFSIALELFGIHVALIKNSVHSAVSIFDFLKDDWLLFLVLVRIESR
jgi:hypothetical protein